MMVKRKSSERPRSGWKLLRAGVAGVMAMSAAAAVSVGCLDRPVSPAAPKTNNIYVDEIRQTGVDKIDVLLMIDNSVSMADKQKILAAAVPKLVTRLVTPNCVDACTGANCTEDQKANGIPNGAVADADGNCPAGKGTAEFKAIKDVHVGVISSSLGSHSDPKAAGLVCNEEGKNDQAHLFGAGQDYNRTGFLQWDPGAKKDPPGDDNPTTFGQKVTAIVKAPGESGCGYEASLESWYRFLVDPEPSLSIELIPQGDNPPFSQAVGLDNTLLAQRAAFLRPDSLVAIIMLTDENDCSIVDYQYGHLLSKRARFYQGTQECEANPNDACCQSCAETARAAGCGSFAASGCAPGGLIPNDNDDATNLRCFHQKQRFGLDLLYPTSRYSQGLKSQTVPNRANVAVANPLLAGGRDPKLVFLAGIVGVPWQDIADDASLAGAGLRYLTSQQLTATGRWDVILGDLATDYESRKNHVAPKPPTDPFMIETNQDRTTLAGVPQENPITGDKLVASTSTNPQANKINGHEQATTKEDLQYACTFKLDNSEGLVDCSKVDPDKGGCDCFDTGIAANRPLCQPPTGGPAGSTQYYAKAYPGTRHLQVLKEFGENSIVASICPKVLDTKAIDGGYNPAVSAIIDRLKEALKGKCLPRPLVPATEPSNGIEVGQVPCKVIEASVNLGDGCGCNADERRGVTTDSLRKAVLSKLKDAETCGLNGGTPCESFCTCELLQLKEQELKDCQSLEVPPSVPGYCYVDETVGNPELLKACSDDSKRLLRFQGDNTPKKGAVALIACLGASLGDASVEVVDAM